jgi:hypothetical protein
VIEGWSFNPPPYWPRPPAGWSPSPAWRPDPAWGPLPPGWQLWVPDRSRQRLSTAAAVTGVTAGVLIVVAAAMIPRVGAAVPEAGRLRQAVVSVPPAGGLAPARGTDSAGLLRKPVHPSPPPTVSGAAIPGPTAVPTPTTTTTTTPAVTPTPTPTAFSSCGALLAVYPHGVGLRRGVDRRPAGRPVTNFGRSKPLYLANARLDLDHDGIACEHS